MEIAAVLPREAGRCIGEAMELCWKSLLRGDVSRRKKRGKRFTFWDNSMTTSKIPLFFKGVKCSLRKFLTAEMQGAKMCLLMPRCVVSTSPSASAPSLLCPRLCPWPFQQPVCQYLSPAHPNFDPVPFIITHTP